MRTGVVCDVAELLTNGKAAIPTLQGVKFSDYRQFDLQRAVDVAGDRLDIFTGVDEMLLGALSLGVNGAVGTTYNFAAPLYNSVIDAHFNGQTKGARTGQSLAVNMITAVVKTCGSSGFKAMMKLAGFDCGPCRLPLTNPAEEQIAELSRRLDRLDFFKQLFSGKD